MDSVCLEKDVTEILSDSDHSTKVAPTTLNAARCIVLQDFFCFDAPQEGKAFNNILKRGMTVISLLLECR